LQDVVTKVTDTLRAQIVKKIYSTR